MPANTEKKVNLPENFILQDSDPDILKLLYCQVVVAIFTKHADPKEIVAAALNYLESHS